MARQDRAPRQGGARSSIYDDITTRIIAELEAGRLPWVQPWGTASAKARRGGSGSDGTKERPL
jgi:antirestriction protein ArdC